MWYIYIVEYYLSIKKNEIMMFAAAWMDLKIIILSEASQRKTNKSHMWNLKYDTKELIYKTKTDLLIWRTDLWLPSGMGSAGKDGLEVQN